MHAWGRAQTIAGSGGTGVDGRLPAVVWRGPPGHDSGPTGAAVDRALPAGPGPGAGARPKAGPGPRRNSGRPLDHRRIPDCRIDPDKVLRHNEMEEPWTIPCGPEPAVASIGLTSRLADGIFAPPTVRGQWCSPRTPGCPAGGHGLLDTVRVTGVPLPARPAGTRASRNGIMRPSHTDPGKRLDRPMRSSGTLDSGSFRRESADVYEGHRCRIRRPHAVSFHVTPVGGKA
jgi:hypothetical protein